MPPVLRKIRNWPFYRQLRIFRFLRWQRRKFEKMLLKQSNEIRRQTQEMEKRVEDMGERARYIQQVFGRLDYKQGLDPHPLNASLDDHLRSSSGKVRPFAFEASEICLPPLSTKQGDKAREHAQNLAKRKSGLNPDITYH